MLRILMDNIYTNQQYLKANPTWHDEDSPWKASQVMALLARNRLAAKKVAEIGCGAGAGRTVNVPLEVGATDDDYKLVFVGDATMSPYEILQPGGSVEHYNKEPGAEWLQRMITTWPKAVWLNPEPQASWQYRQSIALIRNIVQNKMFPVTVSGIEQAMRLLSK